MIKANTQAELEVPVRFFVENSTEWDDLSVSILELKLQEKDGVIGTRCGLLQRKAQLSSWKADDFKRVKEYLRSLIRGNKTDPFLLVPVKSVIRSLEEKLYDEPIEKIKESIHKTLDLIKTDVEDGCEFYIIDGQNRLRLAIVPFLDGKIRLGDHNLKVRELVSDGKPDVSHSLAGKSFDQLPVGIQEYIQNIKVPLCIAKNGTIDDFTDSLIDKNEGIPWTPWMKFLTKNTFTPYRDQIEKVHEEDGLVGDRIFNYLGNSYRSDNNGHEKFISEMLIWMHSQKQPALTKVADHIQYFQGLPIIPDEYPKYLVKYLREFAEHGCKTKDKKTGTLYHSSKGQSHLIVRNYVMFRFMLDHKGGFAKKFTTPDWKPRNKKEFVSQFILKHAALNSEAGAKEILKAPDKNGNIITNVVKVPLFFPWACSEYHEMHLDRRLVKLIECFEKDRVVLLNDGVIKIDDKTPMKPKDIMYDENPHDYKGRKIKASQIIRGEFHRGHKVPKSKGGSNTDLTFQGKDSNLSYGANDL